MQYHFSPRLPSLLRVYPVNLVSTDEAIQIQTALQTIDIGFNGLFIQICAVFLICEVGGALSLVVRRFHIGQVAKSVLAATV